MMFSKGNGLVFVLVVISCLWTTTPTTIHAASLNSVAAAAAPGAGSAGATGSAGGDGGADKELAERILLRAESLMPRFEQLASQQRAPPTGSRLINRDDDHHWNIEQLLNGLPRYGHELSPVYVTRLLGARQPANSNDNNLFVYANELAAAKQLDKKRNIRALQRDEDKDYSFVVGSEMPGRSNQQEQIMFSNRFYIPRQQRVAAPQSKWAAAGSQKLRDLRMLEAARMRPAPGSLVELAGYPTNGDSQLSQFGAAGEPESSQINSLANELMEASEPKNREKRRRCKMDPNLGVKNPSFCDTDAYFGAADYSMRDVWDSAGRKR